ncbi:MAG: esterase-like activity of phytase family protein [Rhodobacteraceae bacterium]|nr:esterase-like activity of phytase family protein [Paracoccaceae bacterium]
MPHRAGRGLGAAILFGLGLGLIGPAWADHAEFAGRVTVPSVPGAGGLSGLELSDDGAQFTAISDRGGFLTGRIARGNGTAIALTDLTRWAMRNSQGRRLHGLKADAEGLAIGPDGRFYVSFERDHRILSWLSLQGHPFALPAPPGARTLPLNGGMEALAISADGALHTLAEEGTGPLVLWRRSPEGWKDPLSLPRRGRFRPVGADFGPDGRFYLLERDFFFPLGFRTRVRRFDLTADGALNETELLSTPFGQFGNLEGVSVWRGTDGAIRLSMVSDNNTSVLQRNQFVEYRVVTDGADR